jgi:hypothetical protein
MTRTRSWRAAPGLARRTSCRPGRTTPFLRTYAVIRRSVAVAANTTALQSGSLAHATPRLPPRGAVTAFPGHLVGPLIGTSENRYCSFRRDGATRPLGLP